MPVILSIAVIAAHHAWADDQGVDWFDSYDAGMAAAAEQDKAVLVAFEADWCVWCKKMEVEVYGDPTIAKGLRGFICIRVDVDKDPRVAMAFHVETLPRTFFLNTFGEVMMDQTGFIPADEFGRILDDVTARAQTKLGHNRAPAVKPLETPAQLVERTLREPVTNGEDPLLSLLGNPDPAVREEAQRRVQALGDESAPLLVYGLSSDYLGTRIAALDMLKTAGISISPFDPWAPKPEREGAAEPWSRWVSDRLATEFSEAQIQGAVDAAVHAYRSRSGEMAPVPGDQDTGNRSDTWLEETRPHFKVSELDTDSDGSVDTATVTWPLSPGRVVVVRLSVDTEELDVRDYWVGYSPSHRAASAAP